MKVCNFLRLDPDYPGVGLDAGSKPDVEVWNEFAHDRERLTCTALAIRTNLVEVRALPTTVSDGENYEAPEGVVPLRLHRSRERNQALMRERKRRALAQLGRLECEVCNFDFKKVYGEICEGFIECHYSVPVSELRPGQRTKLSDLALVCANCHRMLHRPRGTMTIDALRAFLTNGG
jgi:5-methylcytosine-specific restriction enzyme A